MPPRVFQWGRAGLNLTGSPLHIADDELLRAQNVLPVGRELEDGLRKRDGLVRLLAGPLAGAVFAVSNIPFPGPVTPEEPTTTLYWLGLGDLGAASYSTDFGYTQDVQPPIDPYVVYNEINTYDGWVYYAQDTETFARWDGTSVETWTTVAGVTIHGSTGWEILDYVVTSDGVYALVARSSVSLPNVTARRAIIRCLFDGSIEETSQEWTGTYNPGTASGVTAPDSPITLFGTSIFTGSVALTGTDLSVSTTRIFQLPLSTGVWQVDKTFGYVGSGDQFLPYNVRCRWEERGNVLWYGQRVNDALTKPYLCTYDGASWTDVERMTQIACGGYAPVYASGDAAVVIKQMFETGALNDPLLEVQSTENNGAAWTTLDSWMFKTSAPDAVSRWVSFGSTLRAAIIGTDDSSLAFFTYAPLTLRTEYVITTNYSYVGMLVQP